MKGASDSHPFVMRYLPIDNGNGREISKNLFRSHDGLCKGQRR